MSMMTVMTTILLIASSPDRIKELINDTDMSMMFSRSQFNGDISRWNVGNVIDMSWMFSESQFNGDISQWNVRSRCI